MNFNIGGGNSAPRKSNFELLRIVAMLLVLIVHADFFSLKQPDAAALANHPVSSLMRYVVESLALVCVNVYIIISGYFGIRIKLKSVANFIFMLIFWRIAGYIAVGGYNILTTGSLQIPVWKMVKNLFPGHNDWFASAYILLMLLSPIINSFISSSSVRQLWRMTAAYIGFQFCFAGIILLYPQFVNGYSVLSFIGLYLLGATIHKSGKTFGKSAPASLTAYAVLAIAIGIAVFLTARYIDITPIREHITAYFQNYNSIGVVTCSLLLFLGFSHLKIQSNIINRIAASTFAVYLMHMHPAIAPYYHDVCEYLFYNFSTAEYLLLISGFIAGVFVTAIVVDQLRKWLWTLLWRIIEPPVAAHRARAVRR